jgi:monofunctional biosynthetic peptidoglycan transglycosylase
VRLLIGFVALSLLSVVLLRFVAPPVTPLMLLRVAQGALHGARTRIDQRWVGLEKVSPSLLESVIAAEDARYFRHHGVDFTELGRARDYNARQPGGRVHGASTISMQCARSTFLWTDRSYVRKALELYFTALIELLWGKRRILEMYVNVIEWGDGIYGIEAAAQRTFGVPAARLSPSQAALLAAVLPSPRRWSAASPSTYIRTRAARIAARARQVDLRPLGLAGLDERLRR